MTLRLMIALLGLGFLTTATSAQPPLEFNRDIRPILSNNCFLCHGPDKSARKGDLRLDVAQGLYEDRGEGVRVIVRGRPLESEIYRRLVTHEPAMLMPPAKTNKKLTPREIATIKTWIEQGGEYQKHWSLIPPRRAALPSVKDAAWVRNPIDQFILARLEQEGLRPSPAADRRTLIRRLSFDLTGLPPTPDMVDAFLADTRPDAYERLVQHLLDSPHYGERMALYWLDLVRFADTGGYHSDNHRDVTPYRDWVIDAFNKNVPYDRFTVEQLAGDLLPGAGWDQKIASGYNRMLQTTQEGGSQAKEYLAKYFADRVRNVSTVWMGMTLGCTECHDHPYDPFSNREFYQFGAFFADLQERAVGQQAQTLLFSPEQEARMRALEERIGQVQKAFADPDVIKAQAQWETEAQAAGLKDVPDDVAAILRVAAGKRNPKQKEAVANHFRAQDPCLLDLQEQLARFQKEKDTIQKTVPQTLISMAGAPRTIRILPRGNWLDDSGEVVEAGTPASLPPLKAEGSKPSRLDLSRWLVAPENPLTARVFANRLWMLAFGQGLSKVLDDLGSQGAWPTHPELLDWLALEFQARHWDVKEMIRLIVTSNTYRQSSLASAALRLHDPYNQLLARQGRFRLDAEMVRDNALAVSGLLVPRVGGASVKPYQPAGYLRYLNFPTRDWSHDRNADQYRRGLYTYWQRTFLHPSLLAFDAPTREECTVERPRSNTPQQALVLLNDPTYVEVSRALAETLVKTPGVAARVQLAFRQVLQRPASADEVRILTALATRHRAYYDGEVKDAEAYLRVGERPVPSGVNAAELAAWTNVARAVLNLHETITRN